MQQLARQEGLELATARGSNSSTGYQCVHRHTHRETCERPYIVYTSLPDPKVGMPHRACQKGGKRRSLGTFRTAIEGALAYARERQALGPEYADTV